MTSRPSGRACAATPDHGGGDGDSGAVPRAHPSTGTAFASPVPPGTGWPGDPAMAGTPVATDPPGVVRLAAGAGDLAELDACVSVCRACPRLVAWREEVAAVPRRSFAAEPYWGRPVPGFGDRRPWLLVVGLAPAAHGGNRTGRVFTGDRSGDWIFAALHRAGLASQPTSIAADDGQRLSGARMAAAVRCAPPGNRPLPAERDACAAWLDREVSLCEGSLCVVLALGSFAWDAALACARRLGWTVPRPRPVFGHGARTELGRPVRSTTAGDGRRVGAAGNGGHVILLGSYHVSQQNTFTGRLTEPMLDAVLAGALMIRDEGSPEGHKA
jgi:uracil-DNA glycosylase family 4